MLSYQIRNQSLSMKNDGGNKSPWPTSWGPGKIRRKRRRRNAQLGLMMGLIYMTGLSQAVFATSEKLSDPYQDAATYLFTKDAVCFGAKEQTSKDHFAERNGGKADVTDPDFSTRMSCPAISYTCK